MEVQISPANMQYVGQQNFINTNVQPLLHPPPSSFLPPNQIGDAFGLNENGFDEELISYVKVEPDQSDQYGDYLLQASQYEIHNQEPAARISPSQVSGSITVDNEQLQRMANDIKNELMLAAASQQRTQSPSTLKPFPCEICGKTFGRISHVRRHQLLHTGEKPFKCDLCPERFTRLENRTRHMSIHTGERRYNCELCNKGFSQLNRLNVHLRIHTGERPFICEVCGKGFGRIDHRNSHMKTHQMRDMRQMDLPSPPPPPSPAIYQQPSDPAELKMEMLEKPFKCTTCGKPFARKDHLNRHVLIHSGAKPYECNICAKLFSRKDNKYKHMASCIYMNFGITVKKPNNGEHSASTELEDFKSLERKINEKLIDIQNGKFMLQRPLSAEKSMHDVLHTMNMQNSVPESKDGAVEIKLVKPEVNQSPSEGDSNIDDNSSDIPDVGQQKIKVRSLGELVNGSAFTNESVVVNDHSELDNQLATNTEQTPVASISPRSYPCELCDKVFLHKNHLVRHTLMHTGEKPYKCDQCEKGFFRKEHLQRHVIVHTGIKPYQCNFCDKSFFQIGQQMKHLIEHVKGDTAKTTIPKGDGVDDSFQCDRCDKVFANHSQLQRHYTVHTGEKPYKCELCDQRFSRLEHKKRHMTIHTNEKRYECEFCDKKFPRPDHMLAHIKTHEGVLPYKCNQCGKRFQTSKEKAEHLRTHTGAYRCEMCFERFEMFVDLCEHRRTIHLQNSIVKSEILVGKHERYPCPVCQKYFSIVALGDHLKTHVADTANNGSLIKNNGHLRPPPISMDEDDGRDLNADGATADIEGTNYDSEDNGSEESEGGVVDVDGLIQVKVELDEYDDPENNQISLEHNYY